MKITKSVFAASLVLLLAGSVPAFADGNPFQANLGASSVVADKVGPLGSLRTLETLLPLPWGIIPSETETISILCQAEAGKGNNHPIKPIKKAKGIYETDLQTFNTRTGLFTTQPVRSGSFKTGSDGVAVFSFDVPTALFADGFESGDISAWTRTRVDFKTKKGSRAGAVCSIGYPQ